MSKVIGKPLDVEPSSPPSGAVDRSTRSPTNSVTVNPLSMPESAEPTASTSTEWAAYHATPARPSRPPPERRFRTFAPGIRRGQNGGMETAAPPNDLATCHRMIRELAASLRDAQRQVEQLGHRLDLL